MDQSEGLSHTSYVPSVCADETDEKRVESSSPLSFSPSFDSSRCRPRRPCCGCCCCPCGCLPPPPPPEEEPPPAAAPNDAGLKGRRSSSSSSSESPPPPSTSRSLTRGGGGGREEEEADAGRCWMAMGGLRLLAAAVGLVAVALVTAAVAAEEGTGGGGGGGGDARGGEFGGSICGRVVSSCAAHPLCLTDDVGWMMSEACERGVNSSESIQGGWCKQQLRCASIKCEGWIPSIDRYAGFVYAHTRTRFLGMWGRRHII